MNKPKVRNTLTFLFSVLFLGGVVTVGYVPEQSNFQQIIIPYVFSFAAYIYFLRNRDSIKFSWLIGLAILARLVLIFSFPNLSDDIFRFIWDGRLIHQGISPFTSLPGEMIHEEAGLKEGLYERLNSPNYYSIYPPISQLIYYLATFFPSENLAIESILMKSVLFAADLGCIRLLYLLLKSHALPTTLLLLYALNPLIIIELIGNLHFEGLMICLLFLGLFHLKHHNIGYGALFVGLSVGTKLLTLLFIPSLLLFLPRAKRFKFSVVCGLTLLLLFAPLLLSLESSGNFGDSLDLYMRKFEFNAGLYYVLRWIGYGIYGYNLIHILGPFMTIIFAGLVLIIAQTKVRPGRFDDLMLSLFWIFFAFIMLSRTVHPWYLSMMIALSAFVKYRFTILWSALIVFTYVNYSYQPYFENLWVVGVEYVLVISFLFYEFRYAKTTRMANDRIQSH